MLVPPYRLKMQISKLFHELNREHCYFSLIGILTEGERAVLGENSQSRINCPFTKQDHLQCVLNKLFLNIELLLFRRNRK